MTRLCVLLLMLFWAGPLGADPAKEQAKEEAKEHTPGSEGLANKLLAPGPLMQAHRGLEHSECLKCHDAGNGVPDQKCLTCHTDIKRSLDRGKTFHGMTKQPCIGCHSDHKGRDLNSTAVNQKTFKHSKTGFELHGAHAKIKCVTCHLEKRGPDATRPDEPRFFGKTETCNGCHKKDDVHFFPAPWAAKECSVCHSEKSWKGATFDHKKDAHYALVGSHAKVKCATCHVPKGKASAKYDFPELAQKQCLSCHADFHKDKLGPRFAGGNCLKCHGQDSWKIKNFDHLVTGFELKGKHKAVACVDCHKPKSGHPTDLKHADFSGLKTSCQSCHKDYHGFRGEASAKLGPLSECKTCHVELSWKQPVKFNHNEDTTYPLDGKHAQVACFACHLPLSSAHPAPDAAAWKAVRGQKTAAIERKYPFPELAAKSCESCHKSPHKNEAAAVFRSGKCTTCHSTKGWKVMNSEGGAGFNHNTMTRFVLTGDHSKISCASCHVKGGHSVYKFANQDKQFCVSCHASVHQGQFEPKLEAEACSTCHNTTAFKTVTFNHDESRFKLTGVHLKIGRNCVKCHKPSGKMLATHPPKPAGRFLFAHPTGGFCVDCHASVHKNQFEPKLVAEPCSTCHNTTDFKTITFNHNESRFKLTGAHAPIANDCSKCHKPSGTMLPTKPPKPADLFVFAHPASGFCVDCHKNIHKDEFRPEVASDNCLSCHNVKSFKDVASFNHDTTRFKLVDAHASIKNDCGKCHIKTEQMLATVPPKAAGKFRFELQPGLSGPGAYCLSCHKNVHVGQFKEQFAKQPCLTCHTQKTFTSRLPFDHDQTAFKLLGKHQKIADHCGDCHLPTSKMLATAPPKPAGQFIFPLENRGYCEDCHKPEHLKQFHPALAGQVCTACHNQSSFATGITFDHHKNARFDVKNKHAEVKCRDCHLPTKAVFKQPPHHAKGKFIFEGLVTKDCALCHKDPHGGRFGAKCSSCHNDTSWDATASFHKDFVLSGVHGLLECSQCHVDNRKLTGMGADCKMCHQKDDIHLGTQSDCKSCHNQQFWSAPNFQHAITNFPLRGAHRMLQCGECHAQGVYLGKSSQCISCHLDDAMTVVNPSHKIAGFTECELCHNQFQFRGK